MDIIYASTLGRKVRRNDLFLSCFFFILIRDNFVQINHVYITSKVANISNGGLFFLYIFFKCYF